MSILHKDTIDMCQQRQTIELQKKRDQSKSKDGQQNAIQRLEHQVEIPMDDSSKFSCRQFVAFIGPGFLMSIAYLDPGNIESDLRTGTLAGYSLLWVLLSAHILGLLLQRLSARLGVVSGKDMAEVSNSYYPKIPRLILWIMVEIAIIGADMQEVIGTAIAINLLSHQTVPLYAGVLITVFDTLTFLLLDRFGFRKLEVVFCVLIATMAVTFGAEYVIMEPSQKEVLEGVFIPRCQNCNIDVLLQAVGVIGAVIMPHNLYLYSSLVKTRRIDRTKKGTITKANRYYFSESTLALLSSFIINLFVVSVFAAGLANKSNRDARHICEEKNSSLYTLFEDNDELVDVDIYKGGIYLGCRFGDYAMYIWAVGILAAGQSSTMAGCYAGQFVMEGFLNISWSRWKRVLFTRSIAIVPTLLVAVFQDVGHMTGLNDILNALQMMILPFALIPVLTFTGSLRVMKSFRMGVFFRVFLSVIGIGVICINLFFLFTFITDKAPSSWVIFLALGVLMFLYFCFVIYLTVYCVLSLLNTEMPNNKWLRKLFPINDHLNVDSPWLIDESTKAKESESSSADHHNVFTISKEDTAKHHHQSN